LRYKSFHEHARTFENWNSWFETGLVSRFYTKRASKLGIDEVEMAEGITFYNSKRKSEGKTWMAKLRRDCLTGIMQMKSALKATQYKGRISSRIRQYNCWSFHAG